MKIPAVPVRLLLMMRQRVLILLSKHPAITIDSSDIANVIGSSRVLSVDSKYNMLVNHFKPETFYQ